MFMHQNICASAREFIIPQIDAAVLRLVDFNNGIKDTLLTLEVLVELSNHPLIKGRDPVLATTLVAQSIHRLILTGELISVDYETPHGSFSFVLPRGSKPSIAMSVAVVDNRTRH
jgi:hypothetical protein